MQELLRVPEPMRPWDMRVRPFLGVSPNGKYILVDIEQADIEQHHQVIVLDENERPLRGVWVIFGFPGGGPDLSHLAPDVNYWDNAPAVLKGNARKTDAGGYAQHTVGSGGEDIWVWDVEREGDYSVLRLPSTIVQNCTWRRPPIGWSEHTGVRLTFQRQRAGVKSDEVRLAELEAQVTELEAQVKVLMELVKGE